MILKKIEDEAIRLFQFPTRSLAKKLRILSTLKDNILNGRLCTKREIYYSNAVLYGNQLWVDNYLKTLKRRLELELRDLNVLAGGKGLFYGKIDFIMQDMRVVTHFGIIPNMDDVKEISMSNNIVLVVEKETVFNYFTQILATKGLANMIIVTGKGYPDKNIQKFLVYLENTCRIYGIFDFDPFGLHIYTIYKYGVQGESYLGVRSMVRLGVCYKWLKVSKIQRKSCLRLNRHDRHLLQKLKMREELIEDLAFMEVTQLKIECENICFENISAIRRLFT